MQTTPPQTPPQNRKDTELTPPQNRKNTELRVDTMQRRFMLALVQLPPSADKAAALDRACQRVREAAQHGARLVVLPECFNSPYGTQFFETYAETVTPPQRTFIALSRVARESKVYLIGGSFPERKSGKFYNTCLSFSPTGELLAIHRKLHLFDINVPGEISFCESKVLSPGDKLTEFNTEFGRIGVGICYDVRFPEMAQIAARHGCCAMIYPGAFNLTTGPLHWDLLARARALDNQMYVAMCSPARDMTASYHAYGHSIVVDPNGVVIAQAGQDEEIVYAHLDIDKIREIRTAIPVTTQRRFDVYPDVARLNSI
ncbi:Hydrolase [Neolecta irregularis DAH-3]|uniref:Hydrolase n=1 Tax=Neolecta irregularis (strain DAH-3) TaxID=1198029 RepID=A0A1U7LIK5_NEOID|nr:Hydrolase [Neolecta irregularis DAH-3]|eukprot:OLL22361.1 Hydrolase [Neolecta irregularis DAH-3]